MKAKRSRKKPIGPLSSVTVASHKATQRTISTHHTLLKQRAALKKKFATSRSISIQEQLDHVEALIAANGGLPAYQEASKLGQSAERGGDTSNVLIEWLEGLEREGLGLRKGSVKLR
jgi:uncharacterized protein YhaN